MSFVKLTDMAGKDFYVNMDHVLWVSPSPNGSLLTTDMIFDVVPGHQRGYSAEYYSYEKLEVKESPAQVADLANGVTTELAPEVSLVIQALFDRGAIRNNRKDGQ